MRSDFDAAGAAPSELRGSLTTDPDRFSDAAWDLLLASQDQARRWRHGQMDVEHLLQVLLGDARFAAWIDPLPIDVNRLLDRLDDVCAEQPTTAGRELFIGDALEDLLEQADRRRRAWGSRLLDVPHLLLALLDEPRIAAALLADEGLSEDLLLRQLRPAAEPPPQASGPVPAQPQPPVQPQAQRPPARRAPMAPAAPGADDWIDAGAPPVSPVSPAPPPGPEPARAAAVRSRPNSSRAAGSCSSRRRPRQAPSRPMGAACGWSRSRLPWNCSAAISPPPLGPASSIR